jgi:hypothetical protein
MSPVKKEAVVHGRDLAIAAVLKIAKLHRAGGGAGDDG